MSESHVYVAAGKRERLLIEVNAVKDQKQLLPHNAPHAPAFAAGGRPLQTFWTTGPIFDLCCCGEPPTLRMPVITIDLSLLAA